MALIFGIDPGISRMGVAGLEVNTIRPEPFKIVYADTLRGDLNEYEIDEDEDHLRKAKGLVRSVNGLIENYEPDYVLCEDNYLERSPSSFKKLVELVTMLRYSINMNFPRISFQTILPRLTKQIINVDFKGTTKEDVRQGLLKTNLINRDRFDLNRLSEHANDAILIALYHAVHMYLYYGWIEKDPITNEFYITLDNPGYSLRATNQ